VDAESSGSVWRVAHAFRGFLRGCSFDRASSGVSSVEVRLIPRQVGSTSISAASTSSARAVAFLGGVLLPLGLFAALATAVTRKGGIRWDTQILLFAERHYQSSVVGFVDVALKGSLGVSVAVAAVMVLLTARRGSYALFWALAIGGDLVLDFPLKEIFRRPTLGGSGAGYSFPSGGAMVSVAFLLAVGLTASPRRRKCTLVVGVPLVVAYGLALVYAWWHYPTDVVAGWCIALAWVTGLWLMLRPNPT
jgi:membrane-associated phospholipid phosphatase